MPTWVPLLIQFLPFLDTLIKSIVTLLRRNPTARREGIAAKLENLLLQHQIDRDEAKLQSGIREIETEIKVDDS